MTEIAQRNNPAQDLVEWVRSDERRAQIAMALPEGVSIDRFERATATALVSTPDLAKADRASLYLAVLAAAQRGLVPDGRQGAIVVYRDKAQFLPMIGGVRDTLAEYGWLLKTGTVYANDRFAIDEAEARVTHERALGDDRGDIIGFYAIAKHRDGRQRMATWMSVTDVNEVRDKMGVANNPAWKKWYPQMGEKTVGHRLADDVPLAPQDRRRVEWILNPDLEPVEKAVLMYGPAARESFGELPAGATVEPEETPASSQAPVEAAETEQAEEAMDEFGEDNEPVATADDDTSDADIEAAQTAAGFEVSVPAKGSWANGLTLAEINARGEDGQTFFRWALGAKNRNATLRSAVEAYAKVQLPFLYGELVETGEQS